MFRFSLPRVRRILCLGAHSDDIEIGAGGTLLRWVREHPGVAVRWVVFSAEPPRDREARRSAASVLRPLGRAQVEVHAFRTSFFPFEGGAIKEVFERLKPWNPDVVFTHYREDRHQDHRVLSDLTWNTWRDHLILEYEIPKYDGDLGIPNLFVPLDEAVCRRKVRLLMRHFRTQSNKHWFSEETFLGLMRLRGMECGVRFAEAFHARKLTL